MKCPSEHNEHFRDGSKDMLDNANMFPLCSRSSRAAMDWNLAIEKNREALKRIVALLVAMIGSAGASGGPFTFFPQTSALPQDPVLAEKSKLSPAYPCAHPAAPSPPLRAPAVASGRSCRAPAYHRRRSWVGGRACPAAPACRQAEAGPQSKQWLRHRRHDPARSASGLGPGAGPAAFVHLSLPLFDPLKRFGIRRRWVKPSAAPRIRSFDDPRIGLFDRPRQLDPLPPSPDDLIDAGRLHSRLAAMASALNDLPLQAKRLARWQARRIAESGEQRESGRTNRRKPRRRSIAGQAPYPASLADAAWPPPGMAAQARS